MHASLRRLAAVCLATAAAFGLAAGGTGASANGASCPAPFHPSTTNPDPTPQVQPSIVSQVLGQSTSTDQDADARGVSAQVLPINLNAPIQVLSLGTNGGDVDQHNTSVAASDAVNRSGTVQVAGQSQDVDATPASSGDGNDPSAGQDLGQHVRTDQDADARSASVQVAPVNVNAPIQVLSVGSNGGDTDQSNTSVGDGSAANRSTAIQGGGQSQDVDATPASSGDGNDPSAGQDLGQHVRTDQDADARSASVQVAPVNVNAPIQVLSVGSNGGDTDQSNTSVGTAHAGNAATTIQGALQHQLVPLG